MVFGLNSNFKNIPLDKNWFTNLYYEDEEIIVVEKPAGLPVHQTKDPNRQNFTDLVSKVFSRQFRTLHRLDLGTSGLLVLGKEGADNRRLDQLLKETTKEYLFLSVGSPDWDSETYSCFLREKKGKMESVRSGGKKAITDFLVLHKSKVLNSWLGKANLITGRRHQIRVSLSLLGHPILGDVLYGDSNQKEDRMFLHSFRLNLPIWWGQSLHFQTKYPDSFLRRYPDFLGEDLVC